MADEEEAVQVAVRMRCFNGREKDAKAERIVRMEKMAKGSRTFITNPETREERKFEYDYSFQTFSPDELSAGPYASQETVFKELGEPVMHSALEGRNVCLFAYGQTGAGKSFSMLGKPDQPGIIPRTCDAIFQKINLEKDPSYEHNVDIQVVEIYCEQINDLLADRKSWPQHGHKPRLTDRGYVVDTIRKPCFQYSDINDAFSFADGNRSVGSHALNPESSRAHTIYTINYERKKRHESGKIVETVFARLNLIDLAGSERTTVAGTSGQMLKEGNAINLSLTSLGSCIKALSENKKPNFRDSKLTLLLQGSMTNGKVVMIAAVSPASICFDETMSTLRFADRIKQVKIKAAKNVLLDPVADIKKAMEEMRNTMQEEIDNLRLRATGGTEGGDPEAMEKLRVALQTQQEEAEQMRLEYEKRLQEMNQKREERMKKAQEIAEMQKGALGGACFMDKSKIQDPHLRNLHEDPRLAETLVYTFKKGTTVIGRSNPDRPPDLEFNGMGIIKHHAEVTFTDNRVFITPSPRSRTLVNGKPVDQPTELRHNYRLWLGNNYAFRVVFPKHESEGDTQFGDAAPDYAFAEQEIAKSNTFEINTSAASHLPKALTAKLSECLKKVEQANIIAKDLGKNTEFEAKMFKNRVTGEHDIAVMVQSGRGERYWPWEKFESKLVEFSQEWERWERMQQSHEKYQPPKEDLFDDDEAQLIGEADVWLQALSNMMEFDCDAPIISVVSKTEGRIHVDLLPCDNSGRVGPWRDDDPNDPFVDDPEELLGRTVQFQVRIKDIVFDTHTTDSKSCRYGNTWVRYKIMIQDPDERWSKTEECKEKTFNPIFGYEKTHKIRVDENVLKLFKTGRIILQVWGNLLDDTQTTVVEEVDPQLEAELADKRKTASELERQIEEKRRLLAALL